MHDIPNTVEKASYNVIKNGANFFNVHATGGIEMMKAAKRGAMAAAEKYNKKKPLVLAVTVLTSINQETLSNELSNKKSVEEFVIQLAKNAREAGLDGVVASAKELKAIKREVGEDDQQRIATPSSAIKDGADFIVLGRAVTSASDKIEAIKKIYEEIQGENI